MAPKLAAIVLLPSNEAAPLAAMIAVACACACAPSQSLDTAAEDLAPVILERLPRDADAFAVVSNGVRHVLVGSRSSQGLFVFARFDATSVEEAEDELIPAAADARLVDLLAADVDGDGVDDILARFASASESGGVVEEVWFVGGADWSPTRLTRVTFAGDLLHFPRERTFGALVVSSEPTQGALFASTASESPLLYRIDADDIRRLRTTPCESEECLRVLRAREPDAAPLWARGAVAVARHRGLALVLLRTTFPDVHERTSAWERYDCDADGSCARGTVVGDASGFDVQQVLTVDAASGAFAVVVGDARTGDALWVSAREARRVRLGRGASFAARADANSWFALASASLGETYRWQVEARDSVGEVRRRWSLGGYSASAEYALFFASGTPRARELVMVSIPLSATGSTHLYRLQP